MTTVSRTGPASPSKAGSQHRCLHVAIWFFLAWGILAGHDPWRLTGWVRVMDPPVETLLAPDWAWSTPVWPPGDWRCGTPWGLPPLWEPVWR